MLVILLFPRHVHWSLNPQYIIPERNRKSIPSSRGVESLPPLVVPKDPRPCP